ncbi:MAG: transcriptional repressor [Actinobacteria bacterium]|nr:transcriptional repressor [Actinomycetota bacterium]
MLHTDCGPRDDENRYRLAVGGWREQVETGLVSAGLRRGGARRAVVEYLARQDCCRSAQEIHEGLREAGVRVGIASVYRVLDLLAELRLVQRVDFGDGTARYEPLEADGHHHHHVVCRDCGRVEAFEDARLEDTLVDVAERLGYAMETHEVVLHGACGTCRSEAPA